MPRRTEDVEFEEELPSKINPYKVLDLEKTATEDDIKRAYRKLALKHHPDKALDGEKEEAKEQFQKLSFAYGILSDPRRRSRYDTTGRTEESAHLDDDDDFNWSDFFRSQFAEVVSADAIEKFKESYQGSSEEKLDVISSYINNEGDMDAIFEEVMLSNPLDDEERFRAMIDEEIREKRVEAFDAYTSETKASRKKRHTAAKKEAQEAMEMAEELGVKEKLFGKNAGGSGKKRKAAGDEPDVSGLQALIQQRQKSRAGNFLADLEAKYAPSRGKANDKRKKDKARGLVDDEPPEEAFERNRKRAKVSQQEVEDKSERGKDAEGPRRSKRARRA